MIKTFYDVLAEKVAHPNLIFLNYGFVKSNRDPYDWVKEVDQAYKYHLNLAKHVLLGVNLKGKTVLEIGSGRGGNCYYLSHYTKTRKILGMDICHGNVQFCKKVYNLSNVRFLVGNAEQIPFSNEQFDVVLNVESSHCYADFEGFLSEVRRVLKPKGMFCYADLWRLNILPFDWSRREKVLRELEFTLMSEEDISEQVFKALRKVDGLTGTLAEMSNSDNRELIDRLVQLIEAVRISLAAGQCSYKVWRLRKL